MLGKSKIIGLVLGVGVIALVILGLLGHVTVSKKESKDNDSKVAKIVNSTSSSSDKSKKEEVNTKSETSASSSSSSKMMVEQSQSETKQLQKTTVDVDIDSPTISKATPPKVTANKESKALILEREVFKIDNVYIFSLKLTLPRDSGEAVEVRYFTSASNFDKVKSGDLLKVVYGEDDSGNIVIASVDTVN